MKTINIYSIEATKYSLVDFNFLLVLMLQCLMHFDTSLFLLHTVQEKYLKKMTFMKTKIKITQEFQFLCIGQKTT